MLGAAPGNGGMDGAAATGGELLGGEEPEFEEPQPTHVHAEMPANSHAMRFITSLSRTKRERPTVCANESSVVNDEITTPIGPMRALCQAQRRMSSK